jgi:hypothetical protein
MAWLNGVPDTVRFGARAALSLLATVPIPENYGIHDTYVRDGIAFVFAWNTGVMIFDVGNGIAGGTPAAPVLVSTTPVGGGEVHNGWWFHPPGGPARYLFTGQEGPGTIGASSGGDIHVLDVTDLAHPQEAAFFHMPGAGTHNFWMDEAAGILYAAYYNGGVIALNVSGVLSGDLSIQNRLLANTLPGGVGGTYVWGVQLYNGSLYASDMLSGFWRLSATDLSVVSGGNNVPDRYSSDLWVANGFAFTGTWGARAGHPGNALKVWQLGQGSDPAALVDSVVTLGIGTVSDVEVSPNGALLVFSAENGPNAGVHFYGLADPAHPSFLARYLVASGIHTASMATVGGRLYLFAARDPSGAALMIFDITDLAA